MSVLFDLIDRIAPMPKRFDTQTARATIPDFIKESTNKKHVIECAARYIEWKTEISDLRIDLAKTHRLLLVVLALMIGDNFDTISKIWAFVAN